MKTLHNITSQTGSGHLPSQDELWINFYPRRGEAWGGGCGGGEGWAVSLWSVSVQFSLSTYWWCGRTGVRVLTGSHWSDNWAQWCPSLSWRAPACARPLSYLPLQTYSQHISGSRPRISPKCKLQQCWQLTSTSAPPLHTISFPLPLFTANWCQY